MARILVVEDDPAILRGLADNLRAEGHHVLQATDGEAGLRLARAERPALVLLDLMLPKLSGYEVCKQLRGEDRAVPILMLTARGDEGDRVVGLDMGADDYVTKPFSVRELMARVRALLRRASPGRPLPAAVSFGGAAVDFKRYEASRRGRPLELTRKEFGVLQLLASRPGEVVRREEMLDEVWGYEHYPTTRTVDNHVASLRAKFEDDPSSPRHIVTVHGVGYKLVVAP